MVIPETTPQRRGIITLPPLAPSHLHDFTALHGDSRDSFAGNQDKVSRYSCLPRGDTCKTRAGHCRSSQVVASVDPAPQPHP
jgi:hypothetical protein